MNKNETFIFKANNIHFGRYDYSLVEYISSAKKVSIICKEHGVFEQVPNSHLRGIGCSKCSGNYKSDTNSFIIKSNLKHQNKYDYSLVKYKNALSKVKIICPEHGEFEQTPNSHLDGCGCNKCGCEDAGAKNSMGLDKFIEKSTFIHNNKYDYKIVKYYSSKKAVKIICPEHGIFEQIPFNHMKGADCPKCRYEKAKLTKTKTNEEFIIDAHKIHQNKYDYSLVEYKGTDLKVKIVCPEHGIFEQKCYKHLQNHGCPTCSESKLEKEIRLFLLENNIEFKQQYGKLDDSFYLNGQTLDFYLPRYGIAIECQGDQHFMPVDFGNRGEEYASEAFKKNLIRDFKKYLKCGNAGIEILYYCDKSNIKNSEEYIGGLYCVLEDLIKKIKNEDE